MSKRSDIARLQRATVNLLLGIEATDRHLDRLVDRVEALEDANRRTKADEPHTDDLRTRIAAVLFRIRGFQSWDDETEECREMFQRDADVLIRELGLRRDPIAPQVAALLFGDFRAERHRYVTDWTA